MGCLELLVKRGPGGATAHLDAEYHRPGATCMGSESATTGGSLSICSKDREGAGDKARDRDRRFGGCIGLQNEDAVETWSCHTEKRRSCRDLDTHTCTGPAPVEVAGRVRERPTGWGHTWAWRHLHGSVTLPSPPSLSDTVKVVSSPKISVDCEAGHVLWTV